MNLRDSILSRDDLPRRAVEVPEWGATVYVSKLSGRARHRLEIGWAELNKEPMRLMALMVVLATVDEQGKPVFDEGDVDALLSKNADAIERVFKAATEFNSLSVAKQDQIEGNFEGVNGGNS